MNRSRAAFWITSVALLAMVALAALTWWRLQPVERSVAFPPRLLGLPLAQRTFSGHALEALDQAAGQDLDIGNAEVLVYGTSERELHLWVGYASSAKRSVVAAEILRSSLAAGGGLGQPLQEGLLTPGAGKSGGSDWVWTSGSRFFWLHTDFPFGAGRLNELKQQLPRADR